MAWYSNLPSLKSVFAGSIIGFFLIQILSLLISSIFPSVPILKGGLSIFLILLAVGLIALFNVGFNFDKFDRMQLIFVIIVFVLIGVAYWKLPEVFPQLFSISPETSSAIKNSIGSIVGVSP